MTSESAYGKIKKNGAARQTPVRAEAVIQLFAHDDDAAVRLFALGIRRDAGMILQGRMKNAALVGVHRLQRDAAGANGARGGAFRKLGKRLGALVAIALGVENDAGVISAPRLTTRLVRY